MLVFWCQSEKNKELEGLTFAQLGEKKKKHPYDAAAELAAEEMGAVMTIEFGGTGQPERGWQDGSGEPEISWQAPGKLEQVRHPFSTIQSDAVLGKAHQSPAAWGTAPRVLGRYAREMGLITMEEAVKKLTFNPAGVLRVDDRGMIRKGNYADFTIFNPKTVIDTATWKEQKAPEGIEYVVVNGMVVLEKGVYHKDRLAGQIVRSNSYYG
jgi:N-acyl-D-amino-acid deacylase